MLEHYFWQTIVGLGAVILASGAGLWKIFKMIFPELSKALIEKVFGKKELEEQKQNGYVRTAYCKLQHDQIGKAIDEFSQTVASNASDVKRSLSDYQNSMDRRIAGIHEVTQLILKSHGEMKEDIGYLKGKAENG